MPVENLYTKHAPYLKKEGVGIYTYRYGKVLIIVNNIRLLLINVIFILEKQQKADFTFRKLHFYNVMFYLL